MILYPFCTKHIWYMFELKKWVDLLIPQKFNAWTLEREIEMDATKTFILNWL